MSETFFEELAIPEPDVNLSVGSLSTASQTAEMLRGIATVVTRVAPDLVIVRGDTNSTLAGALAAKQQLLPLLHVEAGMRSYDRTMLEEINRVVADHIADVQCVTDEAARERLASEGITRGVHVCGDVMYDIFLLARPAPGTPLPHELERFVAGEYDVLTLHRAENTDDGERLRTLVDAFAGAPRPVVFPVHPRTAARLDDFAIALPPEIVPTAPLGYRDIVALECGARAIFTDSGGVQREAYFAKVPCVTLRDTTEWTNTVDAGWNRLAGASQSAIRAALHGELARPHEHPELFGDGRAAERIAAVLDAPPMAELVAAARRTRAARGYAAVAGA